MALSINHATKVITVPTADLTLVSGTLYEYSIDTMRLAMKALEDDADGMTLLDTHKHTPPVTLAGVTFARQVEIINGYTITFQDAQIGVNIIGGNSNIGDVLNRNQVSVNTANSAGAIQTGSGVTAQDKLDIADQVWDEAKADHVTAGSTGKALKNADLIPVLLGK